MSASKQRIYFLLQVAAAQLKKEADRQLLGAAGISTAQAAVLMIVKSERVVRQKDLARRLQQGESAITTMVARLLSAQLVRKERSSIDARAWEIRITDAGESSLRKAHKVFSRLNAELDGTFSARRIDALAKDLESIIEMIDSTTTEH